MFKTNLLIFFLFLCLPPGGLKAQEPLPQGPPPTLPLDYSNNFVPFTHAPPDIEAPLAASIKVNGENLQGPKRHPLLKKIFYETTLALLPPRHAIVTSVDLQGREHWHYPEGTQIIHLFELNTEPRRPFELRLIQKRADGTWAYGLYLPEDGKWRLQNYRGFLKRAPFWVVKDGTKYEVEMSHIRTTSCRSCHFANAQSLYQYPEGPVHERDRFVGPCGFVPANKESLLEWAQQYELEKQSFPFAFRP